MDTAFVDCIALNYFFLAEADDPPSANPLAIMLITPLTHVLGPGSCDDVGQGVFALSSVLLFGFPRGSLRSGDLCLLAVLDWLSHKLPQVTSLN